MAQWKSYNLKEIINKISEKEFILPVVQRDLVWKENQITLLFDTLLKGDSFGGIMTIEDQKNKPPLFSYREFIQKYHVGISIESISDELSKNIFYVVDGQQRLSAFYIGITGSYNDKKLYFNILSDVKNKDFNFAFAKEKKDLPSKVDNIEYDTKSDTLWYSVSDLYTGLLNTGISYRTFIEINENLNSHEKKNIIEQNIETFQQQIFTSENIGVCNVQSNRHKDEKTTRNEVVELFRRLNQGGTKLNAFDLMASKLKAFNAKNEKFLYDIKDKYSDIGFGQNEILKLIFLLQGNSNKGIADISEDDSAFISENEDKIKATLELLKQYPKIKELNIPIIPKYFIAYHLYFKNPFNEKYFENIDTVNADFDKMNKWIKISLLNPYVFSRSGAGWQGDKTGVRKILDVMKINQNKDFPYQDIINVYKNHPLKQFHENITVDNIDFMDKNFVFRLIYLNEKNILSRINDIDHIQPKSKLEGKYEWHLINSIANFQLLDFSTNRGTKNNKEFFDWINEDVENKQAFIKFHLIPENEQFWKSDNFNDFVNARKELIVSKINEQL